MTHWLYVSHLETASDAVVLEGSEASHAVRARRLRTDDRVCVFDGMGRIAKGRIRDVIQRPLQVHLAVHDHERQAPPAVRIHLCSALPKGDRQTTMLDMAAQLGMTDFTPLKCDRSVSQARAQVYERWQRVLIESCKQSHRPWLPSLHPPVTLRDWIDQCGESDAVNVVADRQGTADGRVVEGRLLSAGAICLVVGPEGGFSDAERAHLSRARSEMLHLGDGVLRVETAAVALMALAGRLLAAGLPEPAGNSGSA